VKVVPEARAIVIWPRWRRGDRRRCAGKDIEHLPRADLEVEPRVRLVPPTFALVGRKGAGIVGRSSAATSSALDRSDWTSAACARASARLDMLTSIRSGLTTPRVVTATPRHFFVYVRRTSEPTNPRTSAADLWDSGPGRRRLSLRWDSGPEPLDGGVRGSRRRAQGRKRRCRFPRPRERSAPDCNRRLSRRPCSRPHRSCPRRVPSSALPPLARTR
jgi:hypothetical protein